jgi:formylglycine-generating enzyme required for sulfatase activity
MLAIACIWLAVVVSDTPAGGQEAKGSRWALLIGVNAYANLEGLRFPAKDMRGLAAQLVLAGFPEKNVFLLHDDVLDKKYLPVRANIERQLELVLQLAEKNDLVLVAFSGHGMHLDRRSYLCPTEADLRDPPATMVAVDKVYDQLSKSRAALKLILVDACRNDPRPKGQRSATPKEDLQKLGAAFERPPPGIMLLSSCGAGQVSWEDEKLGHGVFMNYLLEGLAGRADKDKNGSISLMELYEYAWRETKVYVARVKNDYQSPALRGEIEGVFELGRASPPPGSVITNSIGIKLTLIPAGEFVMGTSREKIDRVEKAIRGLYVEMDRLSKDPGAFRYDFEDEYPAHRVRITRPFYLGTYEVTVGQFRKFVNDAGYKTDAEKDGEGGWGLSKKASGQVFVQAPQHHWRNPGFVQTDEHPVVNVSWNDAVAFCAWLSRNEGPTYRLPTEAEWEYACRAGTTTSYYCGDDPEKLAVVGNVCDRTAREWSKVPKGTGIAFISARDGYAFTAPVGRFQPNGFGLYDMHGNVAELCADWYDSGYYANSGTDDPTGPSKWSDRRVCRGGGWGDDPWKLRAAFRSDVLPAHRVADVGFRVARGLSGG